MDFAKKNILTVKELIEILSKFNKDAKLTVITDDNEYPLCSDNIEWLGWDAPAGTDTRATTTEVEFCFMNTRSETENEEGVR